jgi:hypothetical protein
VRVDDDRFAIDAERAGERLRECHRTRRCGTEDVRARPQATAASASESRRVRGGSWRVRVRANDAGVGETNGSSRTR